MSSGDIQSTSFDESDELRQSVEATEVASTDVQSLRQEFEELVRPVFASLTLEPRARLAAVAELFSVMREQAAASLQPAVTQLIREAIPLDYQHKVATARYVNPVLMDARLSILNPETRMPARLSAWRPRPTSAASALRLEDSQAGGNGHRASYRFTELSPDALLTLVSTAPDHDLISTDPESPASGQGR